MKHLFVATVVLAFAPLSAFAQSNPPAAAPQATLPISQGPANAGKLGATDANFVKTAAAGGMAEVQAGQVAEQQGSASIRTVAQHMVDDHTKSNGELQALAKAEGFDLPMQPDSDDAATIAQLKKAHGKTFDNAYLTNQLTAHQKTIAAFQQEADQGMDPQLKEFASTTLPTLRAHLQMVKVAMSKVGKSAS